MLARAFVFATVLLLARQAIAVAQPAAVSKASGHDYSVTGSLILLDVQYETAHYNLVELTGEWRYTDKIGLAAIVGLGRATVEDEGAGYDLGLFDLGGQAYYCLLGDFDHSLQLGMEAFFLGLNGADRYNGSISARLQGLSVGPFLGYKLALRSGFTVVVQAGAAVFASTVHADYDESDTEYDERGALLYPLANLNLGWSF